MNVSRVIVAGGSTMTKPDFGTMTRAELRAYVLAHRDDDDAIEALIRGGNSNSPTYAFPQTEEDLKAMDEILRQKLKNTPSS